MDESNRYREALLEEAIRIRGILHGVREVRSGFNLSESQELRVRLSVAAAILANAASSPQPDRDASGLLAIVAALLQ